MQGEFKSEQQQGSKPRARGGVCCAHSEGNPGEGFLESLVSVLTLGAVLSTLVSVFLSGLFLGLALAAWIADCVIRRKLVLTAPGFVFPLALFLLLVLVSIAFSPEPAESIRYLKRFIKYSIVFLICTYWGREQVRQAVVAAFLILGTSAAWGILQFFWLKDVDLLNRIDGFMSHWMTFSGQLMLGSVALAAYLVFILQKRDSSRRKQAPWLIGVLGLCLLALLLTYTRGAWIGLAGGVGVLLALVRFRYVVIAGVLAATVFVFLPDSFRSRVYSSFDLSDTTTRGRLELLKTGMRMIQSSPWTGVGPRLAYQTALEMRTEDEIPGFAYQHLHNNLVQIAAELGVPAALAWIGVWLWVLRDFLRMRRRPDPLLSWAATAGIGVLASFQLMGLFEYNFGDSEVAMLLLFLVSVPYALRRELLRESGDRAESRSV